MSDKFLSSQFSNFRGLYDRDDSGLIPSDPAVGVYASAILNVTCDDGTINMNKGYEQENDGVTLTTHAATSATYIRKETRLRRRDGQKIIVSQTNDGQLEWKNTVKNRYEILKTGLTSGVDIGIVDFNKTSQDRTYFCDGTNNLSFWTKAIGYYASDNGSTVITLTLPNSAHTTLAQGGFSASGTVVFKDGTTATYSGLSGMTLTGCSALPPSASVGDGVAEAPDVATLSGKPIGKILFKYQGRLGVVVEASPTIIQLSAVGDGTDFSTSGVAGTITLNIIDGDGRINAVVPFKTKLVVFKDGAVIPVEILQIDATTLRTNIQPLSDALNLGPGDTGQVVAGVDEVYWVAPSDKDIKQLSRVSQENSIDLASTPIADTIRNTLKNFTLTNSRFSVDKRFAYITALDQNNLNVIIQYDIEKKTFYVHQLPAFSHWWDENNVLHFTDPNVIKSYRMFSGFDADGGDISYLWRSGRLNLGTNFYKKDVNLFAIFGKMSSSSEFTYQLDYNNGALTTVSGTVKGDGSSRANSAYMLKVDPLSAYGVFPYGLKPYGGEALTTTDNYFLFFRPLPANFKPYDVFVSFSAQGSGNSIKILSFGLNPIVRKEVSKYRKAA